MGATRRALMIFRESRSPRMQTPRHIRGNTREMIFSEVVIAVAWIHNSYPPSWDVVTLWSVVTSLCSSYLVTFLCSVQICHIKTPAEGQVVPKILLVSK